MEKTSILRLLRCAATRPQSITSSTRSLFTFARKPDGVFRDLTRARSTFLATKRYPNPLYRISTRFYSAPSDPSPEALTDPNQNASAERSFEPLRDAEGRIIPTYQLTFTCKPCRHRSAHSVSKLSYHTGAVLIQCPNCKTRHVITDHLRIFGDKRRSLEDILKENGDFVKRGTVNGEGDVEFLPDV